MTLKPDLLRAHRSEPVEQSYGVNDTMLYAVGVGAGAAPADRRFVYEPELRALPTLAVVLGREAPFLQDARYGIDFARMLAAEQSVELHQPMPPSGCIIGQTSIERLHDKGEGRGAIMTILRALSDAATGDPLADVRITVFLRGNGGFGGLSDPAAAPHALPDRAPDRIEAFQTTPEQAILYRLTGDYNPIHVEEAVAQKAGLPGPILHGLCTYGIACRAVLRAACEDDPARIRRFDARFTSPVYPGDLLVTEVWRDGDIVSFRSCVPARGVVVLNNGLAALR